jgi:hypothetical protein
MPQKSFGMDRYRGKPVCVCVRDNETTDHVLWGCKRFDAERPQLLMNFRATDTEWGTPIRDMLGGRDSRGVVGVLIFP